MANVSSVIGPSLAASWRPELPAVVQEFTAAWERGETPRVEDYLARLAPDDSEGAVDLIYRAYCLAEADGQAVSGHSCVERFPRYAAPLRRLLRLHDACSASMVGRLFGQASANPVECEAARLPDVGDSVGPYLLRRELGRGSFARVFLAEQADLANRLVVVKIATRSSREPWLLARARHAHIVEIVSHAVVDETFQLICMPFWGGATLAAVLGERARSRSPRTPRWRPGWNRAETGTDLLTHLDKVAAPEYPSVHPARPAREVIARLRFDQAVAWVIARLAEALDHAACQEVIHGDVKPSNVLLSADGSPMLLDFNLARDEALDGASSPRSADAGGTLAYMAPERLRAVAAAEPPTATGADALPWPAMVAEPQAPRRTGGPGHLADIYSLGMVLLETLCGRPGTEAAIPAAHRVESTTLPRAARLRSAAQAYAAARERPAAVMIRDVEAASGRPIAPALRAILGRCLDPDPDCRYRRALELAEDLDRWRTDRPISYADEPFWGQTVPRTLRVRRRPILSAAVALLAVGIAAAAALLIGSNRLLHRGSESMARETLARRWDDPEWGAFLHSQRMPGVPTQEPDDPRDLQVSRRALVEYGILGPGDAPATGDWRRGDAVRYLPASEREDLETWLMERAYRYARGLGERPGTQDSRRRALTILDRVGNERPIAAFAIMRRRLAAPEGADTISSGTAMAAVVPGGMASTAMNMNPGQEARAARGSGQDARATNSTPEWLDEHLLGFAAERGPEVLGSESGAASLDRQQALECALGHYDREISIRPASFWGHYRASAACFGLGRLSDAAFHLTRCLELRPGNSVIRMNLASCLFTLKRPDEALALCDAALDRTPGHAELYRTRAFARITSGQTGGLGGDLVTYERITRLLPPGFWGEEEKGEAIGGESTERDSATKIGRWIDPSRREGRPTLAAADPKEVEVRKNLANLLINARLPRIAAAELEKILVIEPRHSASRIRLAELAIKDGRFDDARTELAAVRDDPALEVHIVGDPDSLPGLFTITYLYLLAGKIDEARGVAETARDLAVRIRRDAGRAHYNLARVYAALAATEPDWTRDAARQLFLAFVANPDFHIWYRDDHRWFDPVRVPIEAELARMEIPADLRGRRLAARTGPPIAPPGH